jgi:hypothetical protein
MHVRQAKTMNGANHENNQIDNISISPSHEEQIKPN